MSSARSLRSLNRARWIVPATRLAVLAALLLAWEYGSQLGYLDALTWSSPSMIFHQTVESLRTPGLSADLLYSLTNIALGLGCGIALGALTGSLLAWMRSGPRGIMTNYLVALQSVPLLIFYPLLLTVFGLTRFPIVIIVTVVVTVPVTLGVANGLLSVPTQLRRLAVALDLPPGTAYRKVYIPAAIPLMFPGIRLGALLAIVSTIGMEFIVAARGLGYRVAHSYHSFAVADMYASIVVTCAVAVTANVALTALERRLRQDVAS